MEPLYTYRAVIRSIYDGDTIRADIDLGLSTWRNNEPLRLYGIDAPEIRGEERPMGMQARIALAAMIQPGSKVVIRTFKDQTEKYGRYLAVIYAETQPGRWISVNETLIAEGHAVPYMETENP